MLPLISGAVLEAADVDALAVKYKADIHRQAIQNTKVDTIAKNLHGHLTSAGVHVNTLNVEDIYLPNSQGDSNVQAWFNAEEINDGTLSKIKEVSIVAFCLACLVLLRVIQVRGFRVKQAYRRGGMPAINSEKAPVSINHVCNPWFFRLLINNIFHDRSKGW